MPGETVGICDRGGHGVFLPLFADGEQDLRRGLRSVLYLIGLIWLLLSAATASDSFIRSIEFITSRKKNALSMNASANVQTAWNTAVASVTLTALGSSAPQLLLTIVELFSDNFFGDELGPSTVIGSAAFNVFFVLGICTWSVKTDKVKKICHQNLFGVLSACSLLSYLWLFLVVSVISPDVVEVLEGVITLVLYAMFVGMVYMTDKGYFSRGKGTEPAHPKDAKVQLEDLSREVLAMLDVRLRKEHGAFTSDEELVKKVCDHVAFTRSDASYQLASLRHLTAGRRIGTAASDMSIPISLASIVPIEPLELKAAPSQQESLCSLSFASADYAVFEQVSKLVIVVRRTGDLSDPLIVEYKSTEGVRRQNEDRRTVEGTLVFPPEVCEQIIEARIVRDPGIEDCHFSLHNARCPNAEDAFVSLGPIASTRVVFMDDDLPGLLCLEQELIHVSEAIDEQPPLLINVTRRKGCDGVISCKYRTSSGTANEGVDFRHTEGILQLEHGQLSSEISIQVFVKGRYAAVEDFQLTLFEPTGGTCFGSKSRAPAESCNLTVVITANQERQTLIDRAMMTLEATLQNNDTGYPSWKEQFFASILVNGGKLQASQATPLDWATHIFLFPWKLLAGLIPPPDYFGGWLCFLFSLGMLIIITILIRDIAVLVSCTIKAPPAVIGVCLVSVGLSLPSALASKAAALEESQADLAIIALVRNSAVNVLLGIGMPWTIGSIYWTVVGRSAEWQARHSLSAGFDKLNDGGGKLVVLGMNLGYMAILCAIGIAVCFVLLFGRRNIHGGELGGSPFGRCCTSLLLVCFWFIFLWLSISRCQMNAD